MPRTIIIPVLINGKPIKALVDSVSMTDIISTMLLDQVQLKRIELDKPLQLQLVISGSWSTIKFGTCAQFQYQDIDEEHYFNIANISGYDVILDTMSLSALCVCWF